MKLAKSKIIISAVCLVLAVAFAVTVCFAWFAFTTTSKINPWEASTSDAKVKITIYKLDSKTESTVEVPDETSGTTKEVTTVTYTSKMEELPNSPKKAMPDYSIMSSETTAVLLKLEYEVADGTYVITLNRPKDATRGVEKNEAKKDYPNDDTVPDYLGSLSFAIGLKGAEQPVSIGTDKNPNFSIKEAGDISTDSTDAKYDKKILVNSEDSSTLTNVKGETTKVVYFIMDYNKISLGNVFAVIAQNGGSLSSSIKFKNDMTVSISTGG